MLESRTADRLIPWTRGVTSPFAKLAQMLIVAIVVGGAWIVIWGNLGWFQGKRSHLANAKEAMVAKDWERAARHLSRAQQEAPYDREVTLIVIEFLRVTGTNALGLLQQIQKLDEDEPLSPELQLLMAQALLKLGRFVEARQIYEELPEAVQSQTGALELMVSLLRAEGQPNEAAEFAHRALLSLPDSAEKEFWLACEEAKHPYTEVREKARQTLWKFAKSKELHALGAMTYLAADPELSETGALELLSWLDGHNRNQAWPVRLEVVSALIRIRPDLRGTLIRNEVERFEKDTLPSIMDAVPADSRKETAKVKNKSYQRSGIDAAWLIICRWLARERQYEMLLKLLPDSKIEESGKLFSCVAGALAEDQRWSDLDTLLATHRTQVNPIKINIWRALVASHLDPDMTEARNLLKGAIDAAGKTKDMQLLKTAALTAEQIHEHEAALTAYQAMASIDESTAVSILQEAYAKAELLKDTHALLQIARKLCALRPGSAVFSDRLAYLQLLFGKEFETVVAKDSDSTVANLDGLRNTIPRELLSALTAYRLADKERMRQSLSELDTIDRLTPGQRAVAAGLLASIGHTERAFRIAEKIRKESLLPEELILLRAAL